MDLSKVLSISGKQGLFKVISQTKTGALVESFIDKKRMPVFATEKMSLLSEISIFTTSDDVPLKEVFKAIYLKENGGKCIDPKSSNENLKKYMEEVLPEYDKERVYVSDMKKLFSWYNLLIEHNYLNFDDEKDEVKKEDTTDNV
jgi:hypothetical protein